MSRFEEFNIKGRVDSNNSTASTLAGAAVFTGTATDILGMGIVFVNIYVDVASATDGLSIQQSSDGTNWDHSDDYTIAAGATKNFSINPHAQYMRIVYTNGAGAQSAFRLQTVLKGGSCKESSHRVKDSVIGDDDAELIKATLTGEAPDGSYVNVNTTSDGDLSISDNSSGLAIARGDVTGSAFIHKFGNAPEFDKGDGFVTIWDGAEDNTAWELMNVNYSTSADIDSVSSSNAGDSVDVQVQGLDTNYDLTLQTVTLNGQTRVALTTNLIRVFRVKNVGSTDLAGHCICYVNTALSGGVPSDKTKIRAVVHGDNNQTEMAVYTIPNGKTGYMRSWYASTSGAKKGASHTLKIFARPFGQVFQLKHKSSIIEEGSSYVHHEYIEPEVFAEKTDIEMKVNTDQDEASVSGGFDIVLVDD